MRRLVVFAFAFLAPAIVEAHAFNPTVLELRELGRGRVEVAYKTTLTAGAAMLEPVFPDRCRAIDPRRTEDEGVGAATVRVERWSLDCGPRGLAGATVAVRGFELYGEEAVVTIALADGRTRSAVLREGADSIEIDPRSSAARIAGDYVGLGVLHILLGWDHLLFVLGLMLLVTSWRRLLVTITAFTIAHSVTLSLAALGVVRFPTAPVEAVIALSIVLLAVELCRPAGASLTLARRAPWSVAFSFGLLHGFGFAGALAEIGLPEGDIPLALLGFNAGVELGQLMFVASVLLVFVIAGRARPVWPSWLPKTVSYAIGTLASFWLIERIAAFWT